MPKRKRSNSEEFEYLRSKMKKLEENMKTKNKSRLGRKRRIRVISSSSSSSPSSPNTSLPASRDTSPSPPNRQEGTPALIDMNLDQELLAHGNSFAIEAAATAEGPSEEQPTKTAETSQEVSATMVPQNSAEPTITDDALDNLLLEILGDDPSASIEYGLEIHKDLACRLEHIATSGLEASERKQLFAKYLTPANCTRAAAPILNAEIKAALPEAMLRRDKSLEIKQKQLSTAISCLASVMTEQFTSAQLQQGMLQKLMDTTRMLCNMLHTDSKTRRNFAMNSVKRDMKENLSNTKIDKFLFGDNLSETLRSAKAVSKSGTDLKFQQKNFRKPATSANFKPQSGKNLNWKPPAPARRQQGAPPASKIQEPAYYRRNQHANTSRRSSPPLKRARRR